MKKKLLVILAVVVLLTIAACGQKTTPPDTDTGDTDEGVDQQQDQQQDQDQETEEEAQDETSETGEDTTTAPEEAGEEKEFLDDETDVFKGEESQEVKSDITSLNCDKEEKKLTFTIKNKGDSTWQLNQNVPFPAPKGLSAVKIFINNYEANSGKKQYHPDTREVMFGPNEEFSENCGGTVKLEPGETTTCTLYPVKLNRGTGSEGMKNVNQIEIDSPGYDKTKEFIC